MDLLLQARADVLRCVQDLYDAISVAREDVVYGLGEPSPSPPPTAITTTTHHDTPTAATWVKHPRPRYPTLTSTPQLEVSHKAAWGPGHLYSVHCFAFVTIRYAQVLHRILLLHLPSSVTTPQPSLPQQPTNPEQLPFPEDTKIVHTAATPFPSQQPSDEDSPSEESSDEQHQTEVPVTLTHLSPAAAKPASTRSSSHETQPEGIRVQVSTSSAFFDDVRDRPQFFDVLDRDIVQATDSPLAQSRGEIEAKGMTRPRSLRNLRSQSLKDLTPSRQRKPALPPPPPTPKEEEEQPERQEKEADAKEETVVTLAEYGQEAVLDERFADLPVEDQPFTMAANVYHGTASARVLVEKMKSQRPQQQPPRPSTTIQMLIAAYSSTFLEAFKVGIAGVAAAAPTLAGVDLKFGYWAPVGSFCFP